MILSRPLSLVAALALLLTACDTAGLDADAPTGALAAAPSGPTYLTFASQQALLSTYDALMGLPVDQASVSKSSSSFTSMQAIEMADADAVEQGQRAPADARVSIVEDAYFASLLSPGGVVRIGDILYKVGATAVFIGKPADAAAFESQTEADLAASKTYDSVAIQRTGGSPVYSASDSRCGAPMVSGSSTYKVCGMTFSTDWFIFRSAGANTKTLKKWWTFYLPTRTGALSMTSTYRIGAAGQPLPAAKTLTTDGSGTVYHVFYRGLGTAYGWASTTHRLTIGTQSSTISTTISIP